MRQQGSNKSAAFVAVTLLAAALAGPAIAMESVGEAETAGTSPGLELRLDDLERRLDAIDERIESASAPRGGASEARPFVETYFEELDRYGD